MTRTTWQGLYDDAAAAGFDKQEYMAARLGRHEWSYDLHKGTLTLARAAAPGAPLSFEAQLLGFEDAGCDRWTWGWAFAGGRFAESMFRESRELRAQGGRLGAPGFSQPTLRLRGRCGHQFALLCCALRELAFYYPCELEKGVLFFGVRAPEFRSFIKDPVGRMARLFPAAVAALGHRIADQRRSFRGYARLYGQDTSESPLPGPGRITVGGARRLVAEFDAAGRLVVIEPLAEPIE